MWNLFLPKRLLRTAQFISRYNSIALFIVLPIALWQALYASPVDYQQGEYVRLMYIHVPSAWLSLGLYSLIGLCSIVYIIGKLPTAYLLAQATAPVGLLLTSICLATGCWWGQPTWGTWWVWDARLTSMLVLWFLYGGYIVISRHHLSHTLGALQASVLACLGLINLPIIKWSVDWWSTLHQPASIMRWGKPAIDASMLWPLGLMTLCYGLYALLMISWQLLYCFKMQSTANTLAGPLPTAVISSHDRP